MHMIMTQKFCKIVIASYPDVYPSLTAAMASCVTLYLLNLFMYSCIVG